MSDGSGDGDEVCSADPNDLQVFVEGMDSIRTSFGLRMEALQTSWNAKAAGNSYVSFPAPFDDAENVAATWKIRSDFVASVRQAFLEADGYDPQAIGTVYTIDAAAIDQALGRSAETLIELGVDPDDAEAIASGTPALFDAVVDGYISVDAAVEVSGLTPSQQRNVLSTDLESDEIVDVLDNDHGAAAKTALLEGHAYRVRVLMLDEEQRSAIHMSDTLPILLGDDEHLSFEEIEKRVGQRRAQIVAGYEEAGLSPDEAQAAYDDLQNSVEFLAVNKIARMSLDGAADDDSKPGDPDADNKFSVNDAQTRATQLLEDGTDSNSRRLWQRSMQARMGTPSFFVSDVDADGVAFIEEYTYTHSRAERHGGNTEVFSVDKAVAEIQAIRRTDPERAAALELAVVRELDSEDRPRFIEQMRIQTGHESVTFSVLGEGIDGDVEVDQADIDSETDRILDTSTKTVSGRQPAHGGPRAERFDANEAEYQLNELAKTNPALAVMVKQQLDHQLEPGDVAELNRLIADSGFFDDIDSAGNHPGEASKGVAKGTANGFIFIGNQLIDTDIRGQREGPIPYFELDNSAQRGGANIGAIAETALAGKGLVKIGAKKWLIRNGDELSEIVVKNADEVSAPTANADIKAADRHKPLLSELGRPGRNEGIREVVGDVHNARRLFENLIGENIVREVKPGVFVADGVDGGKVTFRAVSKSGPPTVDVHGVEEGVRKIKFVSE